MTNFASAQIRVDMKRSVISIHSDVLSGTPVFRGTRVPIQTLFDYLKHDSLEEFLKGFPHVTREMVNEVLDLAAKRTITPPNRRRKTTNENFA